MKKLLVAMFAGALVAAFSLTAQAEVLGFRNYYKPPKSNCKGHCTTSCRNFRTTKCKNVLQWKTKCSTHFRTWGKKCQTYVQKRTICSPLKNCHQSCIRFVNDKGAYIKCFGKLKCKYIPNCRTGYFGTRTVCSPIRTRYTHCTKTPVWTRRCTTATKPGWCVTKCSSICVTRR
ncbi:hypothetical protein L6R29_16880 [Myxococcota bacterium]|nr:hypothetical protein [Myxococcota bacterium]